MENIFLYTLRAVAELLTDYMSMFMIFLIGMLLYRKNKKVTTMQKMITGEAADTPLELTLSQIVIGIGGGVLASLMLSYLGIVFDQDSMVYLIFVISFLLMFINSKFICFSYSSAVIGFASLILSLISKNFNMPGLDPFKIDIVTLMSAVAVLHFAEAVMVMVDGGRGAIPVFSERDGKIVGGVSFQRYWIIPIALFFLIRDKSLISSSGTSTLPNWWPLVKPMIPSNIMKNAVVSLMAFLGVIGYGSVTFTRTKREKLTASGLSIMAYSIVLFILAQLARYSVIMQVIVLIFAPFGHELMLNIQKGWEIKKKPRFVSSEEGIMVLQVNSNSAASKMGLKSGDLITAVNGESLRGEKDVALQNIVIGKANALNYLELTIKRNSSLLNLSGRLNEENKKLGIVYVPRTIPENSTVVNLEGDKFKEVLKKIKEKSNLNDKDDENKGNK